MGCTGLKLLAPSHHSLISREQKSWSTFRIRNRPRLFFLVVLFMLQVILNEPLFAFSSRLCYVALRYGWHVSRVQEDGFWILRAILQIGVFALLLLLDAEQLCVPFCMKSKHCLGDWFFFFHVCVCVGGENLDHALEFSWRVPIILQLTVSRQPCSSLLNF